MTQDPHARPDFDHVIAANEYGFYCVPSHFGARQVPKILCDGGVYEPHTLRFMQRHVGTGDIVTGGAFVGDFFPALARAVMPGAHIHSFEPAPDSFAAARYTLALNHLTCVHLHQVAVGATEAVLPLQIARRNGPLAAGARLTDVSSAETIDVPVRTIDSLVTMDRHVSLLHLDIEGAELPALQGASGVITRNAPIIIVEAGTIGMRTRIAEFLATSFAAHDYRATSVIENNLIFLPLARS